MTHVQTEYLPSATPIAIATPPDHHTPSRGLVIAPDIGGLRPLFTDMAQRLADEHGWAVAAVEPFPGREDMTLQERFAAMPDLDDTRQVGDLVAAADTLGVEPVAVLGFCMGGMYSVKAAPTGRFDRAVSFYGMIRLPEDWHGAGQAEPIEAMSRTRVPVLAIHGTEDAFAPLAHVEELEQTPAQVVRYEGAEHGFVHDPSRPAHRPDDAADAWRRVVEFLS